MTPAARRLYIYYRVPQADLARAVAAVQAMHAGLQARHPGLQAQVLQRVETPPGSADGAAGVAADGAIADVTLMEVYAAPLGVADALLAEIESLAAALPTAALASTRHVERFEPCS